MPSLARIRPWLGLLTLLVGSAVIPTLPALAQARADVAQVAEDVRFLAAGVTVYQAHVGSLPGSLVELVKPMVNARGETRSPYATGVPTPRPRWTAYTYAPTMDGSFSVFSSDGGVTVRSDGRDVIVETHSSTR
jgi:hypothetical protein